MKCSCVIKIYVNTRFNCIVNLLMNNKLYKKCNPKKSTKNRYWYRFPHLMSYKLGMVKLNNFVCNDNVQSKSLDNYQLLADSITSVVVMRWKISISTKTKRRPANTSSERDNALQEIIPHLSPTPERVILRRCFSTWNVLYNYAISVMGL